LKMMAVKLICVTLLISFICGYLAQDCTYECFDWNSAGDRFAACTGTLLAPAVPIAGQFMQEICGGCAYSTDRVKGYFPQDDDNSWSWIPTQDLSNGSPCSPEAINHTLGLKKRWATEVNVDPTCPAPGMYSTSASMVRGDAGDNGCALHHFLGWLLNQSFQVYGPCTSDCFWCQGMAYGDVNEAASVICTELS